MPEPLTLKLAENVNLTFSDPSELRDWLKQHLSVWDSLRPYVENGMFDQVRNLAAHDMERVFNDKKHQAQFKGLVEQTFNKHWHTDHPKMKFVLECQKTDRARSAGRYCAFHKIAPPPGHAIPASFYLGIFDVGLTYESVDKLARSAATATVEMEARLRSDREALAKTIDETTSSAQSAHSALLNDMQQERAAQQTSASEAFESLKKLKRHLEEDFDAQLHAERKRFEEAFAGAKSELGKIRKDYTEFMKVDPTISYWSRKASGHFIWFGVAAISLILSLAGSGWGICAAYEYFIKQEESGDVPLWEFVAAGIIVTLGFWFLRLLAKMMFSQLHLLLDAKERRMFVNTYLALSKEGKIDKEQLAIVLAAIFRPATDGIVKEDGGPTHPSIDMILALLGKGNR